MATAGFAWARAVFTALDIDTACIASDAEGCCGAPPPAEDDAALPLAPETSMTTAAAAAETQSRGEAEHEEAWGVAERDACAASVEADSDVGVAASVAVDSEAPGAAPVPAWEADPGAIVRAHGGFSSTGAASSWAIPSHFDDSFWTQAKEAAARLHDMGVRPFEKPRARPLLAVHAAAVGRKRWQKVPLRKPATPTPNPKERGEEAFRRRNAFHWADSRKKWNAPRKQRDPANHRKPAPVKRREEMRAAVAYCARHLRFVSRYEASAIVGNCM